MMISTRILQQYQAAALTLRYIGGSRERSFVRDFRTTGCAVALMDAPSALNMAPIFQNKLAMAFAATRHYCHHHRGHVYFYSMISSRWQQQQHQKRHYFSTQAAAATTAEDLVEDDDHIIPRAKHKKSSVTSTPLTRTAVHRMRITQLQDELSQRGLDTHGKRLELVDRMLRVLEQHKVHDDNEGIDKTSFRPRSLGEEGYDNIHTDNLQNQQSTEHFMSRQSMKNSHDTATATSTTAMTCNKLDPERTYVIRVRSAPSGQKMQVVEGIGIGMTILVVDDSNTSAPSLTVLDSQNLLLPGARSPFEADYCALIMALREAQSRGIQIVTVEIDDVDVVRTLTGRARLEMGSQVHKLNQKALELIKSFQNIEVRTHDAHNASSTRNKKATARTKTTESFLSDDAAMTKILAKSALAKQKHLESDWKTVDPMTDEPTKPTTSMSLDPNKEYLLRFDGGARGNPKGIAGAGMAISDVNDDNNEVWCGWKYLGEDVTNNVAEYTSLIEGLKWAKQLGIRRIRAEGDSELIVRQVRGEYKVKNEGLKPLHKHVQNLIQNDFDHFTISYIPRKENQRADYLANHAMDVKTSSNLEN